MRKKGRDGWKEGKGKSRLIKKGREKDQREEMNGNFETLHNLTLPKRFLCIMIKDEFLRENIMGGKYETVTTRRRVRKLS